MTSNKKEPTTWSVLSLFKLLVDLQEPFLGFGFFRVQLCRADVVGCRVAKQLFLDLLQPLLQLQTGGQY